MMIMIIFQGRCWGLREANNNKNNNDDNDDNEYFFRADAEGSQSLGSQSDLASA